MPDSLTNFHNKTALPVFVNPVGGNKLSDFDPFENIPADEDGDNLVPFEEPAPAPKKVTKKATPKPEPEGKVTVTLKGGAGFDAPWIVIHANDIPDAYEQFSGDYGALLVELMTKVQKAGTHFSSLGKPAAPRSNAPQVAAEAPEGTPEAPGPDWTYKTGIGKNGKPWKAWMPPRGSDAQPVWIR